MTITNATTEMETQEYKYQKGNATLRSSAHTLTYSKTKGNAPPPQITSVFPSSIRCRDVLEYDPQHYNFRKIITILLQHLNADLIGYFPSSTSSLSFPLPSTQDSTYPNQMSDCHHPTIISHINHETSILPSLEDFHVPPNSLRPRRNLNFTDRQGDQASDCLTHGVSNDTHFLTLFDTFIMEVILPYFKERLYRHRCIGIDTCNSPIKFYYQRPPTLRIQPGPSTRSVKVHCDGDYGHQDGELNFWLPLTHPHLTQTDLWVESEPNQQDYTPVGVHVGQVAVFHGTSCHHYVPPNPTPYPRMSLDFRVGVGQYYDPEWRMRGTKHDHNRRTVLF